MRALSLTGVCVGLLILVLVDACGVSSQSRPVPLPRGSSATSASTDQGPDGYTITVYFVRRGRLVPVRRHAPDRSPATAVALLAAGPTRDEAATGLETAIIPQQLSARAALGGAVTVAAGREFTSIAGDNQLLATAQLVWTATGDAPSGQVRVTVDDQPIEVPTDRGLARRPVTRSDYRSLAPPPDSPAPSTPRATARHS